MSSILEVAIPVPLNKTFDYVSNQEVAVGARVRVPFGRKKVIGIVLAQKDKSDFDKLKTIEEILDDVPILDAPILDFISWSANYYHHPIGEVLSTALPKNLRIGKEAIIKKVVGLPIKISEPNFETTNEQQLAIDEISASLDDYHGFLLHGVTGSGKTEVYLKLAQTVLKQGKQVLVLVPEIGLTPQMITRFASRLNTCIVAIHSQRNETQKLDAYLMAKDGTAGVVLGTRSAIFTPMPNLGLIIIDEEHDSSFKQQSGFRYCARDLCFVRAKQANIPVILGTATPSLEVLKQVMDKRITRLTLMKRAGGAILPKVNLIDMRAEAGNALSAMLIAKMKQHLSSGKQVMLFINRRGYAPVYFCTQCGWKSECDHCDSLMIYHRHINRLKCHHCHDEKIPEQTCPDCGKQSLEVFGYGTQRLEETLGSHFADTPIIRIDRDTTRRKKAFEQHLEKINSGDPCIIVGTQMLAKGHDFSNLAMVGILDIDGGLLSSNFRGTEHLAQLLIQVSGRAGRSGQQGEVTIQTRYPEHPIFNYVLSNRYTQFASTLLKQRAQAKMPPFSHQALICANAKVKQNAQDFLQEMANLLKSIKMDSVEIWGPVTPVMEKKADYYYFNLYLQSVDRKSLHQMLATLNQHTKILTLKNKVRWYLDIDPIE
ncbi:replication restart helicase PriA [bacterium endosymbiont of Bathymodiolus sp. 5 South]|uniref:replication restart helicase PriA n=1 Tax=bacterium endosymbiont of Bathymodiolus sp. 5 South TaxID=1181670 RepID=UPI0010B62DD3|nr:primosomal protein N' [bacterium endosymbiont of Bathymodiolus sp. 5 South]CAC9453279.1 Helicase PriA essential for oriC/DnaA-independent DNA replication [uncultured Gammaproteobacteria bacterium]SHN91338.1 Helicase PriA essential for oriC/DnaA-independent DNA replication [bacterium endosymbiont of Bathymodiolus sp. 5 South]SSC07625.1 Helicase PriA essential for oriC/DnaA-independent DNA replication [bacterium endosymbiont of Bathymodiolus sp. 5 South]VVH57878.1 Helicase PriA essential for o